MTEVPLQWSWIAAIFVNYLCGHTIWRQISKLSFFNSLSFVLECFVSTPLCLHCFRQVISEVTEPGQHMKKCNHWCPICSLWELNLRHSMLSLAMGVKCSIRIATSSANTAAPQKYGYNISLTILYVQAGDRIFSGFKEISGLSLPMKELNKIIGLRALV